MDTSMAVPNNNANAAAPSWDNALVQPSSASHTQGLLCAIAIIFIEYYWLAEEMLRFHNFDCPGAVATNNCSSSIESQSGTWPTSEAVEQENVPPPLRGEFSLMQHAMQIHPGNCYLGHQLSSQHI
jgi:hypothetical protein